MPTKPRVKYPDAMYHIMSRSISERNLFHNDADKEYYMNLLKRYKEQYHCSIYAYCLMDNHVHIFINPNGCDISKFMLGLNSAYVSYFNKHHERHGHLFQGRFASKIVDSDSYAVTLMAYIHNNASDLPGFRDAEDTYRFSSYGIYSGTGRDDMCIVDTEFLLKIFGNDMNTARHKCLEYTHVVRGTKVMAEMDEKIAREYMQNEYRDDKKLLLRDGEPGGMIQKLSGILGERVAENLRAKYIREAGGTRAFVVYVLRVLCGYSYKMICRYIGNMSLSGVSRLFREGFRLVGSNTTYKKAFNMLME